MPARSRRMAVNLPTIAMNTVDSLSQIERQLKQAAASQDYRMIERLALRYGHTAREAIAALPSGDPRIADIARQAVELLEWSRVLAVAGRSAVAGELRRIPFLTRYLPSPQKRAPKIRTLM